MALLLENGLFTKKEDRARKFELNESPLLPFCWANINEFRKYEFSFDPFRLRWLDQICFSSFFQHFDTIYELLAVQPV